MANPSRISVYLEPDEIEMIRRLAERKRLSISAYVRMLLLDAADEAGLRPPEPQREAQQ